MPNREEHVCTLGEIYAITLTGFSKGLLWVNKIWDLSALLLLWHTENVNTLDSAFLTKGSKME